MNSITIQCYLTTLTLMRRAEGRKHHSDTPFAEKEIPNRGKQMMIAASHLAPLLTPIAEIGFIRTLQQPLPPSLHFASKREHIPTTAESFPPALQKCHCHWRASSNPFVKVAAVRCNRASLFLPQLTILKIFFRPHQNKNLRNHSSSRARLRLISRWSCRSIASNCHRQLAS